MQRTAATNFPETAAHTADFGPAASALSQPGIWVAVAFASTHEGEGDAELYDAEYAVRGMVE